MKHRRDSMSPQDGAWQERETEPPRSPAADSEGDLESVPETAYLRLETPVRTARPATGPWGDDALDRQHQALCKFCRSPQSVAEVAAHINVPLGVARLLISYAIALGFLRVHDCDSIEDMAGAHEMIRRVHEGLHRLA